MAVVAQTMNVLNATQHINGLNGEFYVMYILPQKTTSPKLRSLDHTREINKFGFRSRKVISVCTGMEQ